MAEITFEGSDPQVAEARQAEEARLTELGEKIINDQEAQTQAKYDQARADAESELRYAGKFKSAEDLEKAYKELESKLGQKEETETPEAEAETPKENTQEVDLSETAQFIQDASQEFYSNDNQLKPETLEKLREMPADQLIDAYIEAYKDTPAVQQSISDADADAIVNSVGGTDAYNQALAWAADNLKPDEVAAYDNVINSGNKDAITFAVQALTNRYKDAVGFEGQQVSGKSVRTGVQGFRSQAELARAIGDPRYQTDPAYRMDIENKLAASGDLL
tara:strand:- start:368 stop:1198 length:831 start_codon:yes stop_codon:yes gene_type:complete